MEVDRDFFLRWVQSEDLPTGRQFFTMAGLMAREGLRSRGLAFALRTDSSLSHVSAISCCIIEVYSTSSRNTARSCLPAISKN